ncbi:hypothetical protein [Corynebacterium macginleyi]|uniref:hypothetical protein n=1 Tax=Corynebacterium macginleyi TaxID=38290 RepID=UPI000EF985FF|nr:hypothetical protein [Corynebacterium macginleyi]QRJ57439.1 hypothetical protein GWO64_009290 [Corynebacterium macginleyi]QRP20897.1 hypothetical protein I6J25_09435 [Corynebacterium macginleyi]RMB65066.1 hypothetical protein D9V82_09310 [Corynebacterium macginleyi]
MSFTIANSTPNRTGMAADVIVDGVFTYRLISLVRDGLHTLTLRDYDDRTIVARITSEKGITFSNDFMWNWVGQAVKEAA